MIVVLLLAAATPATAVDAERAFATDAKAVGQWTAFRKWAAPDAIMFDPQPVKVSELLKDAKNPPKSVKWWPTASYVSCDGKFAVNTGGWRRPNGSVGYFTTVWVRQADGGWKWIVDGGDQQRTARPRALKIVRASCKGRAVIDVGGRIRGPDRREDSYNAADQTIEAQWRIDADGARFFLASIWTGRRFELVIDDRVAAPPPPKPK